MTASRDTLREGMAEAIATALVCDPRLADHVARVVLSGPLAPILDKADSAEAAEACADRLSAEVEARNKALLLLLPFVDYAAGEGLLFVETEDGEHPQMDAADIMVFAAEALGLEIGSDQYFSLLTSGYEAIRTALARAAVKAETEEAADV